MPQRLLQPKGGREANDIRVGFAIDVQEAIVIFVSLRSRRSLGEEARDEAAVSRFVACRCRSVDPR